MRKDDHDKRSLNRRYDRELQDLEDACRKGIIGLPTLITRTFSAGIRYGIESRQLADLEPAQSGERETDYDTTGG
jgi:hypothetical protein